MGNINENIERDKELDSYGFNSAQSRRGLIYTAFSILILAIIILARQVGIERDAKDRELRRNQEMSEKMYNRLYQDMQLLLKLPKSQIQDAADSVKNAAEKVKNAAEKLENKK